MEFAAATKISSIEEIPRGSAENINPAAAGGGGKSKKDKGGRFLKSLLPSSRKATNHSSTGDLINKKRKHPALNLNLAASVPCSAIRTDNNDNILGSRSRSGIDIKGSGEGEVNPHDRKILQESQELNIKWQHPEYIVLTSPTGKGDTTTIAPAHVERVHKSASKTSKHNILGHRPVETRRKQVSPKPSRNTQHEQSKELLDGQEKLTQLDKATYILFEDELAKKKLKDAVAELSNSCEKYRHDIKMIEERSAQEVLKIRVENEGLLLQLSRANDSTNNWKSKCQQQENELTNLSKLKIVMKENAEMKEDLEVLKSVIRRLNHEMAFYQEKLRSKYSSDPTKVPVFSTSSDSNENSDSPGGVHAMLSTTVQNQSYLTLEPKKNLLPLLIAYDEVIDEKNEIIKDHEVALGKFKVKCQEIVQENEELHKLIGKSRDAGSVSMAEWKFLHDNAAMVVEENELLHEQCKVLRNQAELTEKSHEEKIAKIKSKITSMEQEAVRLKESTKDAHDQCTFLQTQMAKMNAVMKQRIPMEEHDASIRECKRLFEDLKTKYTEETKMLREKLTAVESEKERIANELTDIDAENAKLLTNLQSLEKVQSSSKAQLKNIQVELTNATKSKDITTRAVNEIVHLVQTVIAERESFRASFLEQQNLNQQLMNLRVKESELVEDLREKIQLMETVHEQEMGKYLTQITKLQEVLETVGERHQVDVLQLKELISEKSTHIEKLEIEKEQLMKDLETVWRATTRDVNNP